MAGLLFIHLLGPSPLSGLWKASPQWVALAALHGPAVVTGLDIDQLAGKLSLSPQVLEDWLALRAERFVIPVIQLLVALFVADTWQYFAHRFFHTNKFFYSKLIINPPQKACLIDWSGITRTHCSISSASRTQSPLALL